MVSCVPGCFVTVSPLQDAGAVMGTAWECSGVCAVLGLPWWDHCSSSWYGVKVFLGEIGEAEEA